MLAAAPSKMSDQLRITSTDAVLHAVVAPALAALVREHPLLAFDLHTGNELASLLDDAETDLWLLMHPEARHQRRVATMYAHLGGSAGEQLKLP